MSNGRKTTLEERTEIVAFCIANGNDYGLAAEKYGVSYQQVYSWVHKYEAKGADGLTDRRGRVDAYASTLAKPESELTEADKLRMENKILQVKLLEVKRILQNPYSTNRIAERFYLSAVLVLYTVFGISVSKRYRKYIIDLKCFLQTPYQYI